MSDHLLLILSEARLNAMQCNTAGFKAYEMEDDFTKDLAEFSLANAIYAALVEGHACEQSARFVRLALYPICY